MRTSYIFLAFIAILMYNAFLINRDDKMFDAYYQETPKEQYCAWHPDCKVE